MFDYFDYQDVVFVGQLYVVEEFGVVECVDGVLGFVFGELVVFVYWQVVVDCVGRDVVEVIDMDIGNDEWFESYCVGGEGGKQDQGGDMFYC